MSETPNQPERPSLDPAVEAQLQEYLAERQREYDGALSRLESSDIEPAARAAYESTLEEASALPINEVAWPCSDPRWKIHLAQQYGETLLSRRADIDPCSQQRWNSAQGGNPSRLVSRNGVPSPTPTLFEIDRYALAALYAFKLWRANPEPEGSFGAFLQDAVRLRSRLLAGAQCCVAYGWLSREAFRHFGGGVTPEGVGCDLLLLAGVLQSLPQDHKGRRLVEPLDLLEATVIAGHLLRSGISKGGPQLWEPLVVYARAHTLADDASFHAELVLSELHNRERDPAEAGEWKPACLFCSGVIDRQRHERAQEWPEQAQRRAEFVSVAMTSALRRTVVEN